MPSPSDCNWADDGFGRTGFVAKIRGQNMDVATGIAAAGGTDTVAIVADEYYMLSATNATTITLAFPGSANLMHYDFSSMPLYFVAPAAGNITITNNHATVVANVTLTRLGT